VAAGHVVDGLTGVVTSTAYLEQMRLLITPASLHHQAVLVPMGCRDGWQHRRSGAMLKFPSDESRQFIDSNWNAAVNPSDDSSDVVVNGDPSSGESSPDDGASNGAGGGDPSNASSSAESSSDGAGSDHSSNPGWTTEESDSENREDRRRHMTSTPSLSEPSSE
jgi:hypothetical protein